MAPKRFNPWMIGLGLILLALAVWGRPLTLQSPQNGARLLDREPVLHWAGPPGPWTLWVDDNPEFTSPESFLTQTSAYRLPPREFQTYYWKVFQETTESPTWHFTVASLVALAAAQTEKELNVTNAGNAVLNLTLEEDRPEGSFITGSAILAINQTLRWPLRPNSHPTVIAESHD